MPGPATAINLGTGRGTTVRELVDAFNRVADRPIQVREAGRRPGDVVGAYTRIGRAERLLGWRAQYDIAEGIRHSLQWAAIRDEILSGDEPARVWRIRSRALIQRRRKPRVAGLPDSRQRLDPKTVLKPAVRTMLVPVRGLLLSAVSRCGILNC